MSAPLRILHTNMLRGWGGQSNRILTEALGAREAGLEVAFAVPHDSELRKRGMAAGLTTFPDFQFKPPAQVWHFLPDLARLRRVVAEWKPDVLHVHGSQDTWLAVVAKKRSRGNFPPILRTKHNIFEWSRHAANQWLYKNCDAYLSISNFIDKQIEDYPGIGAKPRCLIHSIPDLDRFRQPTASIRSTFAHVKPHHFLWGTAARLRSEKGCDILLRAFAELRKTHPYAYLVIAGSGSDRAQLEELAASLGLDESCLEFLGFREDIPAIYRSVDAYVHSSRSEGLGTAILEALACGIPVVAGDVGGIPDSVHHEATGLLAKPEDPLALAAGMARIMDDAALRERLKQGALRIIEESFTRDVLIRKTVNFYRQIVPA